MMVKPEFLKRRTQFARVSIVRPWRGGLKALKVLLVVLLLVVHWSLSEAVGPSCHRPATARPSRNQSRMIHHRVTEGTEKNF